VPEKFRKFAAELKARGYSVERTSKGHYLVKDKAGITVESFAVGHGRNKDLVLDSYLSKIRKKLE